MRRRLPCSNSGILARLARLPRLLRPWYTTVWPGFLTTTWDTAGGTIGSKKPPKRVPRQMSLFITILYQRVMHHSNGGREIRRYSDVPPGVAVAACGSDTRMSGAASARKTALPDRTGWQGYSANLFVR